MKVEERRIVGGEGEVLTVLARCWKNLGGEVRTIVRMM